MELRIYKDYLAGQFIRCLCRIPGTHIDAGGSGWTLSQAISRCQSEVIERMYERQELRPSGIIPLGIAAHLNFDRAQERAMQEAQETLCLMAIHADGRMRCLLAFHIGSFSIGVARTSRGYFAFMRGRLKGTPIASYSAAATFFSTVTKAWEEFQSMRFFKPQEEQLKKFTKAHKLFSSDELKALSMSFEPGFVYRHAVDGLTMGSAERSGRVIVYYVDQKKEFACIS
jgi:hypothetical protein